MGHATTLQGTHAHTHACLPQRCNCQPAAALGQPWRLVYAHAAQPAAQRLADVCAARAQPRQITHSGLDAMVMQYLDSYDAFAALPDQVGTLHNSARGACHARRLCRPAGLEATWPANSSPSCFGPGKAPGLLTLRPGLRPSLSQRPARQLAYGNHTLYEFISGVGGRDMVEGMLHAIQLFEGEAQLARDHLSSAVSCSSVRATRS